MTQTLTAASKPVALDYDNTLVLAGGSIPGLPRPLGAFSFGSPAFTPDRRSA